MILKYIWKNFTRRKVRTILMILALLVSMALIVTMIATVETFRQSNVDLIANETGRFDLAISKRDTSSDSFMTIDQVAPLVLAADERITAVYPRFQSEVELTTVSGDPATITMLALDAENDAIGHITVERGTYELGQNRVAVLADTAAVHDLAVGDRIDLAYSFPLPREVGQPDPAGSSRRRAQQAFTVSAIVRQDGVTGGAVRDGLIISLADAQAWLQLPGRAPILIAIVDPGLYETDNAEVAALRVRDVARSIQANLGEDYIFSMAKASALDSFAQGFLIIQALINTYALISLGVVGLLIHTLVMTNVQEQRRDMAILRILGSQRKYLFRLVIAEVLVIGLIGVGLGIVFGQILTNFVVVPLIGAEIERVGLTSTLQPQVTITAILPATAAAFIVLILSTLKPAQEASRTKVMNAINPSVADNIQIEDLARLRERRPDGRLFLTGLALMLIFGLIAGFQVIENFGNPSLQVIIILLALGLLVLGVGFLFFITTVPFERLVLFTIGLVAPRLTYFARRNVGRGQQRNTLISLLVLFSGVLPSFLATQLALENANLESSVRLNWGAPVGIQVFGDWLPDEEGAIYRLEPTFIEQELPSVPGIGQVAALSYPYSSHASDTIGLRAARVNVLGVQGNLQDVLYPDLVEFAAAGPGSLDAILDDPTAIVVSQGLADYLALELGDTLQLEGEGRDHFAQMRIAGIARRLPGISDIGRGRNAAVVNGSSVLVSLDSFRALKTPMDLPLPPADAPIFTRVFATTQPGFEGRAIMDTLFERYGERERFWVNLVEDYLAESQQQQAIQRVMLLALTLISFTTAVFGVFAVIYVTIYARRIEIGMLKAMGMRRRELTGMLIVEAIAMTLGAALAGIAAGATMAYVATFGNYALQERPMIPALDTTVMPFIVIMVVLASVIGAAFSARRIVRRPAVEILRME